MISITPSSRFAFVAIGRELHAVGEAATWPPTSRGLTVPPVGLSDTQCLTRVRLFRDKQALAEARRLIDECGYHRRDGQLEDAETAAQHWPATL